MCLYCHQLSQFHLKDLDISEYRTTPNMAVSGSTGYHGDETVTSQAEDLSRGQQAVGIARRCTFCGRKFELWPQGKPNSQLSDKTSDNGLDALREACVWGEPRNKLEEQLVAGWREEAGSGEQGGGGGWSQVSMLCTLY